MSDRIVCKPTRWFLLRAVAMILMFGIFAVLFYRDGTTGYREKNLSWYTWLGVDAAAKEFSERQATMTPAAWRAFAATRTIPLPDDPGVLPEGTPEQMPWPEVLGDYEAMKEGQGNPKEKLFKPVMQELGLKHDVPEHAYDAQQIREQLIIFWICLVLAVVATAIFVRTLSRRMALENGMFQPAGGRPVRVSDLVRLDLRRWQSKGLAFAWARQDGGGERKIRIDGLTYGGFKKEQDEPAERLMRGLRAGFSGELIDYEAESSGSGDSAAGDPAQ